MLKGRNCSIRALFSSPDSRRNLSGLNASGSGKMVSSRVTDHRLVKTRVLSAMKNSEKKFLMKSMAFLKEEL